MATPAPPWRCWRSPGCRPSRWRGHTYAPRSAAPRDLALLSTPGAPVPIWWTQHPTRAPVLVGWSGGPRADALGRLSPAHLRAAVLEQLAGALALPREELEDALVGLHVHDWQGDPFARGAYSYPLVGGLHAAEALARPIDGVILAGEATARDGGPGTVEGAIRSGITAARQAARALAHAGPRGR